MSSKWKPLKKHPNVYTYETNRGAKYGIRFTYYDSVKKRHEYKRSGYTTWREAEIELRRFQGQIDNGYIDAITNRNITVEAYFRQISERNVKLGTWRPMTQAQKTGYFKNHLKKPFGKMPLSEVNRSQYQRFIDSLIIRGYAYKTVVTINSIMQIIMNEAERNDIIVKNKLKSIQIQGAKQPKPATLESEQYNKFMETAKNVLNNYWYTLICICALGARREEVAGLTYGSFKFVKDHGKEFCEITYNNARTRAEPLGGKLKNESSYRKNYVSDDMLELLKYSIQYSKNICTKTGRYFDDNSLLFIHENGVPIAPEYANKLFKRVEDACGIHVYPHLLRHYFATMARSLNLSPTDTMHWLGHSNIEMTNAYTRPTKDGSINISNGIEKTLFGKQHDGLNA